MSRMKTVIVVGETYSNRRGNKWKVIKQQGSNFEIHKLPPKNGFVDINTTKKLIVGKYGGFGNYPNHYDLVKLM